MTGAEPVPQAPSPAAPGGYVNPMTVGPKLTMPWSALWAALGAATTVGAAGLAIVWFARPAGVSGAILGWLSVVGAFAIGTVAIRPWKPRAVGALLMAWLGGRGLCFGGVLLLGTLLYFAPHSPPDPLAMGLVLAAAYFAALMAESVVMSRWLRAPRASSPETEPALGSVSRG